MNVGFFDTLSNEKKSKSVTKPTVSAHNNPMRKNPRKPGSPADIYTKAKKDFIELDDMHLECIKKGRSEFNCISLLSNLREPLNQEFKVEAITGAWAKMQNVYSYRGAVGTVKQLSYEFDMSYKVMSRLMGKWI